MISTTQDWKDYSSEIGTFHIKATLNNGTTLNLTDADFMQGSVSITDSISGMGEFTIGSVITNSFNATLNNFSGKFDNYQLAGATIAVKIGIIYEDTTEEWIDRGVYTIEKPSSLGSTIKIVGYDDMDKLNRYYIGKDVNNDDIEFPISADTFAETLCDYCGVTFGTWGLDAFSVNEFEYNESTTCRQVLSWLVQIAGGYARMNPIGEMEIKTFSSGMWTDGDDLDGGAFSPWDTVDSADGGTIQPWSAVTDFSGGWTNGGYTLSKIKSLDVYIEDITITGVRAYVNGTVDEFQFETVGSSGYILAIRDNPFITSLADASAVANRVAGKVKGLMFRPFDASIFGDPSIEAGDNILLRDYLGKDHPSIITSLTYQLNGAESLECNAETPTENANAIVNPATSIVQGAVTAAYDYVIAKKISADYISAGTIEAAVVAKNLTMDGGSIHVTTSAEDSDIIELEYNNRKISISPAFIKRYYNGNRCYYLGANSADPTAGRLELFNGNEISRILLNASEGNIYAKDATGTTRIRLNGESSNLTVFDSSGTNRAYLSGSDGNIYAKDANGTTRVRIDGEDGAIILSDNSGTQQTRIDSTPTADSGYSWFKNRVVVGGTSPRSGYVFTVTGSGYASGSWTNGSLEELKTDIKEPDIDPIEVVNNTDIYQFVYKADKENGLNNITYGAIIGDGYNCDEHLMSGNKDSISTYSMASILWMAVQNQQKTIETLQSEIAELKEKINGNTDQKR